MNEFSIPTRKIKPVGGRLKPKVQALLIVEIEGNVANPLIELYSPNIEETVKIKFAGIRLATIEAGVPFNIIQDCFNNPQLTPTGDMQPLEAVCAIALINSINFVCFNIVSDETGIQLDCIVDFKRKHRRLEERSNEEELLKFFIPA